MVRNATRAGRFEGCQLVIHAASGVPMGISRKLATRIVYSAALCLTLQTAGLTASAQQAHHSNAEAASSSRASNSIYELPDSPGTALAKLQAPMESTPQESSNGPVPSAQSTSPSQQQQQQPAPAAPPQRPVGTAAAEPTHANGIAASQPAGVAVAPAKQHRARTIVIRVGAIVGAGVAVGTVAALTLGTSSRPPGAH